VAEGGGDATENVIGALEKGLELNFTGGILNTFFIADAPSHGK
jgi:hypothetical protein